MIEGDIEGEREIRVSVLLVKGHAVLVSRTGDETFVAGSSLRHLLGLSEDVTRAEDWIAIPTERYERMVELELRAAERGEDGGW